MAIKKFSSILILLALLLVGCDEYSQAKKAVEKSSFYQENLVRVIEYNRTHAFLDSRELWIGKIKQHNATGLIFAEADCLESPRRGLLRQRCSMNCFRWEQTAYPFFEPGDIVLFVVLHSMKMGHDVFNNIAKIEKIDNAWQVIPQKIKQYRQTYYASDSPLMVYAGTGKAQFAAGEKIILHVTMQNIRQEPFFVMVDNPINEFHIKVIDTDTAQEVKRLISKEDIICVQKAPIRLEHSQTTDYPINLTEFFALDKTGNYSVHLSGSVNCDVPPFELKNISFEVILVEGKKHE